MGKFIYLSHNRAEIRFSISVTSQFMHNRTEDHLEVVYRILSYLKVTQEEDYFTRNKSPGTFLFFLTYWTRDMKDRRSTLGYYSYVCRSLVKWRSKKQPVVSKSNVETKFRALSLEICEVMWIRRLTGELGIITGYRPIMG